MIGRRHDTQFGSPGPRAFFTPLAWIVALLACYWLVVDWRVVPELISEALAAFP